MNLVGLLEAMLFLHPEGISAEQLGDWLQVDDGRLRELLDRLEQQYRTCDSALSVDRAGPQIRLTTHPGWADAIVARLDDKKPEPLSHASWEVLAIIAYKQPITRLEIEAIRQTGSERALETLIARQLIEEVGRKDTPGRPILYGTTARFLTEFGLTSLDQLPPLTDTPA
ncbi:MAG: SMC-Scp complex subunit ScpB [Sulfobacillus sp.]|nr:SMC-Scp complex subunit ScpB [Sulfobacillus sp.]